MRTINYLKGILLSLMLMVSASMSAFKVDGISYYTNSDGKSVSVTNEYSKGYSGTIIIPESVTYEEKTYSVTSIGANAFYYSSGLTSITIPNSVTSIGEQAFYNCSGLTSITIPNSVTSIGEQAFYNCSRLTSITIPNSVTSIANQAFYDCSGLKTITIPNSVTSISEKAFYKCSGLTSITIPNSVTSIGANAFYYCSGLTSVTISDNITSIEGGTFLGCSGLTSVIIPHSVTSIGSHAFSSCSGLMSVTIPSSVTVIDMNAFDSCYSLKEVHINNLEAWCKIKFGSYYDVNCASNPLIDAHNLYLNGKLVKELVIPDGITSIGDAAFNGCSSLTSVTIPNSVTSIGDHAFRDCSGLTSITIPKDVIHIGVFAFCGCLGLTSISIPSNVKYINVAAFRNCGNLKELNIESGEKLEIKTLFDWRPFDGCPLENIFIGRNLSTSLKDYTTLRSLTIGSNVSSIDLSLKGCLNLAHIKCEAETPPSINAENFSEYHYSIALDVPEFSMSRYKIHSAWGKFFDFDISVDDNYYKVDIPNQTATLVKVNDKLSNNLNIHSTINYGGRILDVTSIKDYVFFGCRNITSLTIPSSVTNIGIDAFDGCSNLKSLRIDDCDKVLNFTSPTTPFDNCSIESIYLGRDLAYQHTPFKGMTELKNVEIGNSVTQIGNSLFSNCTNLGSITIPKNVKSIGKRTFENCSKLSNLTIEDSEEMLTIEDNSYPLYIKSLHIGRDVSLFNEMSHLTKATFGTNFTSFLPWTFYNSYSLDSIYCLNPVPPILQDYVFTSNQYLSAKLYVPNGSLSSYQNAAGWENFFNIFEFNATEINEINMNNNSSNNNIITDVYNLNGLKIASEMPMKELEKKLESGIYIINGKKLVIKN